MCNTQPTGTVISRQFPLQDWRIQPKPGRTPQLPWHQQTTIFCLRTGHCRMNSHLKRIWRKDLHPMPLWRSGPNTRTLPTVLLTLPPSKAADMAHLCVPQNQALGVCRGFVPDVQVCGTHRRDDPVNATITSNAEKKKNCHNTNLPGLCEIWVGRWLSQAQSVWQTLHPVPPVHCPTVWQHNTTGLSCKSFSTPY